MVEADIDTEVVVTAYGTALTIASRMILLYLSAMLLEAASIFNEKHFHDDSHSLSQSNGVIDLTTPENKS